ncbi:DUF3068 domain-containing protein [Corynebacterium macginleyi]|uniref:DUF3068 domain-containing protein n=1 Tax=Corynebacterium macginleyi TaxID=38290 RepID=UPI000EF9BCD9|nr:DUF3068 domain-containing protein [Corynebacterium macginleyi]MBK4140659.1 DUF3068 domain-containing protein [Corynebacterium macginleyi]MBK4150490.1 DUF3068 domain-containing protein [Corynebacterium macginleyi]MBK4167499.1 DUF3068 domain-containing protein [Corynebacterium macginleyi]QRP21667.1 DUF3068 domain-containing protein [Corynebacterium macginleyi]RMB69203.1 DUF3068 domain-containing protein [Corynebacterium macginleyi]
MLPKSRIFSVLLLGLGVALVVAGVAAPAFLDFSPRLPLELKNTTWTLKDESADSQVVNKDGMSPYSGPMTYQINASIQEPSNEDTATLRIGETRLRGDGQGLDDLSRAQVWTYPIDRLSGEAEGEASLSHTLASPEEKVSIDGYWLKFPANAEKTNYPVFDPTLRKAVDAVFEEETEVEGRTVYRYHQEIEPTNVAQLYAADGNTTSFPKEDGGQEPGYLMHSGSRDFYVDQATGLVVGMEMDIDDYYADREGVGREPAFVFNGSSSEGARVALLEEAKTFPRNHVAEIVRWVVLGIGIVLTFIGVIGALGVYDRKNKHVRRRGKKSVSEIKSESYS